MPEERRHHTEKKDQPWPWIFTIIRHTERLIEDRRTIIFIGARTGAAVLSFD
jgi:hypothetical protein